MKTCYDFHEPLQVSLLWFKSKINDFQIFLISHNESLPDSCIEIFGPYDFEKEETFHEIEGLFQQGLLFKILVPDIGNDQLRLNLERRIRENINCLFEEPSNKPIRAGSFGRNNFLIAYNGNLFNCTIENIISFIQEIKERQEESFVVSKQRFQDYIEKRARYQYYLGGFILPPVWFGTLPELTQKDKLKGVALNRFITRVYDGQISERKIIIENDGYLGIYVDNQTKDIPESELYATIRDLNFLFGGFLLEGIFIKSVQAGEFSLTTYIPDTDNLVLSFPADSKSERLFEMRREAVNLDVFLKERRIIPISKLQYIMKLAEELIKEEPIYESLRLLVQSSTNLNKGEINQAFILSWTIIEQYLNYKWNLLIDSKGITGKRRKKLLKGRDYSISVIIEILNLNDHLSNDELILLNKLRKARNDFMHEMRSIPRDLAQTSLFLARKLIKKRLTY